MATVVMVMTNGIKIVVTFINIGQSAGNQRVYLVTGLNYIIISLVGSSETTREISYI